MATGDTGLGDMLSAAVETPVSTDSAVSTETPTTTTTNSGTEDFQVETADSNTEGAEESTEGKETETKNADGSDKTPEQQEKFKADAAAKATDKQGDPLPKDVTKALQNFKNSDPANAKLAKELNGIAQRYYALKPLLGESGVSGLRECLSSAGVQTVGELRQAYAQQSAMVNAVSESDSLLHAADPILSQNVFEELKSVGKEGQYGRVVSNFVSHLRTADPDAYYDQVAKPLTLAGMDEAGLPAALNSLHAALLKGDTELAQGITKSIAKFYTDLRNEQGEAAKISKERAAWEEEKAEGSKAEQAKATKEYETSVATDAEKHNNASLGKALGGFLKMPFFKNFPRETLITVGNQIKGNLYAALKADPVYQKQISAMWKAKPTAENRSKMVQYHAAKVDSIATDIVTKTIQNMYPGYSKNGSAAGKAAAATSKATATKAAAQQSIASMKPIYVGERPTNLVRDSVKVGGKVYDANALQTLQITGRGFVKTSTGGLRFITWRK